MTNAQGKVLLRVTVEGLIPFTIQYPTLQVLLRNKWMVETPEGRKITFEGLNALISHLIDIQAATKVIDLIDKLKGELFPTELAAETEYYRAERDKASAARSAEVNAIFDRGE